MGEAPLRSSRWFWLGVPGLILAVTMSGYFTIRTEHEWLLSWLAFGMVSCWTLYRSDIRLTYLLIGAFGIRLILIGMEPNLSEDIYRYIWDGQIFLYGGDPYLHVPSWFASQNEWPEGTSEMLFSKLNSPDYFSVYPPLALLFFRWVAWASDGSIWQQILIFRGIILIAEAGSIYLLYKLANRYKLPNRSVLLYALNPVVILELTGNLHLEALMLFFVLLSLNYFPHRIVHSSIAQGAAIATKLVPLILMPVLVFRMNLGRAVIFSLVTMVTVLLLFYPLLTPGLVDGMSTSIGLYFQTFEFNASYYFVLRSIGFWERGYNLIAEIGPMLAVMSVICISAYAWTVLKDPVEKLPVHFGMAIVIYLILSTTVHPWYIMPVVGLFSLSAYRFAFVWSYAVMWSYIGYTGEGYTPPILMIALEYGIVSIWMIYEIWDKGSLRIQSSVNHN